MPPHIQHFVLHIRTGLRIQRSHLELKALPLGLFCSNLSLGLSIDVIVCAIDKAEIRRYLMHTLRNKS
jgi:hypothetical protein